MSNSDLDSALSLVNQVQSLLEAQRSNATPGEGSRREALRLLKLAQARVQKPDEYTFDLVFSPAHVMCSRLAIQWGVFEVLAGADTPMTTTQLAAKVGVEDLLLWRILRSLAAQGIVQETGVAEYAALPMTHLLADPVWQGQHKHFWDDSLPILAKLPTYLDARGRNNPASSTDGPLQYAYDTKLSMFEFFYQKPGMMEYFSTYMEGLMATRPNFADYYPVRERLMDGAKDGEEDVLFVDVGGSFGHDVRRFLHEVPKSRGRVVLQDLPQVIAGVKDSDGMKVMGYDFFTEQPVKGARAYFFSHIFHDWSDESCVSILRNLAPAMQEGYSRLLIGDFILPDRDATMFQVGMDISMMALLSAMERTRSQWNKLLDKAGFEVVHFWQPAGDAEGIIEAVLT